MAKVVRTSIRPGMLVEHDCRGNRPGEVVKGKAISGTRCKTCDTYFVYVRSTGLANPG